jgi:hypothetical protein
MEKLPPQYAVDTAPKKGISSQRFWEFANQVLLLPNSEQHLQSPQKEKLANKLWEYFDAKWELRKIIQQELESPNSVFLDQEKANEWKERQRQEFAGLLQNDTTFDRVVDRLCEALPKFLERKKEYEQNPRLFVDNLIRQSLKNDNFDPDIFDQLKNRELITISFDSSPNMVITIDGQHDAKLIFIGKIVKNELCGWVSPLGIWIEKNTGGKDGARLHEEYHIETNLQSAIIYGMYNFQVPKMYSDKKEDRELILNSKIQSYANGGSMMEEMLASFVQGKKFDQWKLKHYLVEYIDDKNYKEFEDIPEREKALEGLDKTRKLILESLKDFLPIVMQRTGLSELEARQYIASGLSVYYDGSAITDLELIPKRVINTRSIPGMLRIMSAEQINENKKNYWEALGQLARMSR